MKEWRQKAELEEMKALLESNDTKAMWNYLLLHEPTTLEDFEIYKALSNKEYEMNIAENGYDPSKPTLPIDLFQNGCIYYMSLSSEELHLMNLKTLELKLKGFDWKDRDLDILKMVQEELKTKLK